MSNAFQQAVLKRLGLEDVYLVNVETEGGGQVQIGDYTWDTVPVTFEIWVGPLHQGRITDKKPRWIIKKFDTLPEIWEWLQEEPDGPQGADRR